MPLDSEVINKAMDDGATPVELETYFIGELGLSKEESHEAIVNAALPAIQNMLQGNESEWGGMSEYLRKDKGFSDEYINSIGKLLGTTYTNAATPTNRENNPPIGADIQLGELNTEYDLSESIAYARSLGRISGSLPTLIRGGWSQESQDKVTKDTLELNTYIVKALRSQGVDVVYDSNTDELYRTASDGTRIPVDSDFIDELDANIGEISSSVGGAIAGFRLGMTVQAFVPPIGPLGLAAKAIIVAGGSLIGGAIGAATGRGIDIVRLRQLTETKEKLDIQKTMRQMYEAGMDDATYSVALAGIFKLGGAAASRAYQFIRKGNVGGAEKELRKIIGVDDTIVRDALDAYTKNTTQSVKRTESEQVIESIVHNTQGGEVLVAAAITHNHRARGKLLEGISKRAKDTRDAAKKLTNDDMLDNVKGSLDEYRNIIIENYRQVEDIADVIMENTHYTINYNRILGRLKTDNGEVFLRISERSENIGFTGLLNIRKQINGLGESIPKSAKKELIESVDKEITSTASKYMPDSGVWLSAWRDSNVKYAEMKALEKNVLYKTLTRKGVTPKAAINAFSSLITSPDKTFSEVMAALPINRRIEVEGAIIDKMVKNHSVNTGEDISAIHFPKLAESLKMMDFTTKDGKAQRKAIEYSAEWARNDVNLLRVTGDISEPTMITRLFNNPAVRLKLGVYSTAFSLARSRLSGKAGRLQSAIRITADVLENPRNPKHIQSFIDEFENTELTEQVKQLSINIAQHGDKNLTTPKVKLFTTGKPTKSPVKDTVEETQTKTIGKSNMTDNQLIDAIFGEHKNKKSVYSYTSEKLAKATGGGKVKQIEIHPHRIASTEEIRDVLELTNDMKITRSHLNDPRIQEELNDKYLGVKNGEVVRMFD